MSLARGCNVSSGDSFMTWICSIAATIMNTFRLVSFGTPGPCNSHVDSSTQNETVDPLKEACWRRRLPRDIAELRTDPRDSELVGG